MGFWNKIWRRRKEVNLAPPEECPDCGAHLYNHIHSEFIKICPECLLAKFEKHGVVFIGSGDRSCPNSVEMLLKYLREQRHPIQTSTKPQTYHDPQCLGRICRCTRLLCVVCEEEKAFYDSGFWFDPLEEIADWIGKHKRSHGESGLLSDPSLSEAGGVSLIEVGELSEPKCSDPSSTHPCGTSRLRRVPDGLPVQRSQKRLVRSS